MTTTTTTTALRLLRRVPTPVLAFAAVPAALTSTGLAEAQLAEHRQHHPARPTPPAVGRTVGWPA